MKRREVIKFLAALPFAGLLAFLPVSYRWKARMRHKEGHFTWMYATRRVTQKDIDSGLCQSDELGNLLSYHEEGPLCIVEAPNEKTARKVLQEFACPNEQLAKAIELVRV